jgi:SAM-dependent methyltransferase
MTGRTALLRRVLRPDRTGTDPLTAQNACANDYRRFPDRNERIAAQMAAALARAGVREGRMLEVGARGNEHAAAFPGFDYVNLDLEQTGPGVLRGDITRCPQIPSASFDAIVSVDLLEHVREPWLAAVEITRLLRPGGVTYHSTLFSWRYHPCPVDYWRFTPDALRFLFSDLRCLDAGFDTVERRRDLVGRGRYRLTPDAFGGWRENWRVHYAGVRPG